MSAPMRRRAEPRKPPNIPGGDRRHPFRVRQLPREADRRNIGYPAPGEMPDSAVIQGLQYPVGPPAKSRFDQQLMSHKDAKNAGSGQPIAIIRDHQVKLLVGYKTPQPGSFPLDSDQDFRN